MKSTFTVAQLESRPYGPSSGHSLARAPFWSGALMAWRPFGQALFSPCALLVRRPYGLAPFWMAPFWRGALLAWRSFGLAPFWNAPFRRRPFVGALLAGALMRIPRWPSLLIIRD